jgi:hypothetical protein
LHYYFYLRKEVTLTISIMNTPGAVLLAPSPDSYAKYDTMYYLKGAAAGGICCSITHGALTPVDVVKTRMQLDPIKVCGPYWLFAALVSCMIWWYLWEWTIMPPLRMWFSYNLSL